MGNLNLGLITSNACNQSCSYCFLHKNPVYQQRDKQLLLNVKNLAFLKNIKDTLSKLNIDIKDFSTLDFWGGEPTRLFESEKEFFIYLLNDFYNINEIFYSTNLLKIDESIQFINLLNNYSRPIKLFLQVSYDGQYNELTRGINPKEVEERVYKLLDYLNNSIKLKNVSVKITLKLTLPIPLILGFYNNIDKYKEYLNYFIPIQNKIDDIITSKNLNCEIVNISNPAFVNPYYPTREDGLKYAALARQMFNEGLPNLPLKNLHPKNQSKYSCGKMLRDYLFNYDGTLAACPAGFIDGDENNLQWLKENDINEYNSIKKSEYLLKQSTDEQLQKIRKNIAIMDNDLYDFELTTICGQMFDLAQAGLISKIYLQDKETLYRHAKILTYRNICFYWNLRTTGSLFVNTSNMLILYCNGLLEFYDEVINKYGLAVLD